MMENICKLAYQKAVDAIDGTKQVYFKHGFWNPYELKPTEEVKKRIMNSGYGADVDRKDGMLYVFCPCSSDMW